MSECPIKAGSRDPRKGQTEDEKAVFRAWENTLYERLSSWKLPIIEGTRNELNPKVLILDPEAKEAWYRFTEKIERAQAEGGAYFDVRGFASKTAEQALRIACVMAYLDNGDLNSLREVRKPIMEDAIMVAHFYLDEHLRVMKKKSAESAIADASLILDWIHRLSLKFIYRSKVQRDGPNRLRKNSIKLDDALSTLTEYGHLECIDDCELGGANRKHCFKVLR